MDRLNQEFRNWSSTDPRLLEQPHDPWSDYRGPSTRDDILGQYKFLFDTWHIAQKPDKQRKADLDDPMNQAFYDMRRNQIENPNPFTYPRHRPDQVLPEQPLNYQDRQQQVFGTPPYYPTGHQQQVDDFEDRKEVGDFIVNKITGDKKKQQIQGGTRRQEIQGQVKRMIQQRAEEFDQTDEDPEETDDPTNPNKFAQTLPLTQKRGEILQLKNMIQEVQASLGKGSAGASFSALRMETLNSGLRTLEQQGIQMKRQNLKEIQDMLERAIKGIVDKPALFQASNFPKIRVILIFYIYTLKLLQTYDNQKRKDALDVYMENLVDAEDVSTLVSFLEQLHSWSRLSSQTIRTLAVRLRGISMEQEAPIQNVQDLLDKVAQDEALTQNQKNQIKTQDLRWKLRQLGQSTENLPKSKNALIEKLRNLPSGQQSQSSSRDKDRLATLEAENERLRDAQFKGNRTEFIPRQDVSERDNERPRQRSAQEAPSVSEREQRPVGEEKTDEEGEAQKEGGGKNPFKEIKKGIDFFKKIRKKGKKHPEADFTEDEIDDLELATPAEKKKMKQQARKKGQKKGKKGGSSLASRLK